jgi:hypothetical protein
MAIQARLTVEMKDADGNTSQASFPGATIANDAGLPSEANKARTLQAELEAQTKGNINRAQVASYEYFDAANAAANSAQTNIRWRFVFTDNVNGSKETITLGTAELDGDAVVTADGQTYIDLGHVGGSVDPAVPDSGTGKALKLAFENFVVSDAGNPVTLNRVEYVQ